MVLSFKHELAPCLIVEPRREGKLFLSAQIGIVSFDISTFKALSGKEYHSKLSLVHFITLSRDSRCSPKSNLRCYWLGDGSFMMNCVLTSGFSMLYAILIRDVYLATINFHDELINAS